MCGRVTCSVTKRSHVCSGLMVSNYREKWPVIKICAFFRKIARIGESPRSHCPGKKAPACDLRAKGYFLGSSCSIHEHKQPVSWAKGREFTCWFGGRPMALASVFFYLLLWIEPHRNRNGENTQLLGRKRGWTLPPRALVTGLWETACTWVSQASQLSVITVYCCDWPVLARNPYYQLMGIG